MAFDGIPTGDPDAERQNEIEQIKAACCQQNKRLRNRVARELELIGFDGALAAFTVRPVLERYNRLRHGEMVSESTFHDPNVLALLAEFNRHAIDLWIRRAICHESDTVAHKVGPHKTHNRKGRFRKFEPILKGNHSLTPYVDHLLRECRPELRQKGDWKNRVEKRRTGLFNIIDYAFDEQFDWDNVVIELTQIIYN